jgi:hypothetical protein
MNSQNQGGIGCLGVLQIIFLVLKVAGLVDWSWWIVLSPLFIWIVLATFIIIIVSLIRK